MLQSKNQQEITVRITSIIIFVIGLYAFMTGIVYDSLIDMLLGTVCLLLSAINYPAE